MKFSHFRSLLLAMILLPLSCKKDSVAPTLNLFSITLNGVNFLDGLANVPNASSLAMMARACINHQNSDPYSNNY